MLITKMIKRKSTLNLVPLKVDPTPLMNPKALLPYDPLDVIKYAGSEEHARKFRQFLLEDTALTNKDGTLIEPNLAQKVIMSWAERWGIAACLHYSKRHCVLDVIETGYEGNQWEAIYRPEKRVSTLERTNSFKDYSVNFAGNK